MLTIGNTGSAEVKGPELIESILKRLRSTTIIETIACDHCYGSGQCSCLACINPPDNCREDFDSGRQEEDQCRICSGRGRTKPDGTPLTED